MVQSLLFLHMNKLLRQWITLSYLIFSLSIKKKSLILSQYKNKKISNVFWYFDFELDIYWSKIIDWDDVAPHAVDASQAYMRPTFVVSATWWQNDSKPLYQPILSPPPFGVKLRMHFVMEWFIFVEVNFSGLSFF